MVGVTETWRGRAHIEPYSFCKLDAELLRVTRKSKKKL